MPFGFPFFVRAARGFRGPCRAGLPPKGFGYAENPPYRSERQSDRGPARSGPRRHRRKRRATHPVGHGCPRQTQVHPRPRACGRHRYPVRRARGQGRRPAPARRTHHRGQRGSLHGGSRSERCRPVHVEGPGRLPLGGPHVRRRDPPGRARGNRQLLAHHPAGVL